LKLKIGFLGWVALWMIGAFCVAAATVMVAAAIIVTILTWVK
jgi:hypothetical protein